MLRPGKEDQAKNNCRAHHCRDYDIGADYDELCVYTTIITIVIEHNDNDNDDREEADDDDHNALMLTIIMTMM